MTRENGFDDAAHEWNITRVESCLPVPERIKTSGARPDAHPRTGPRACIFPRETRARPPKRPGRDGTFDQIVQKLFGDEIAVSY